MQMFITKFFTAFLLPFGLGLGLTFLAVGGLASANEPPAEPAMFSVFDVVTTTPYIQSLPPLTYRRAAKQDIQVYAPITESATFALTPTRVMKPGFVYLSLSNTVPISYNSELWYHINESEYITGGQITDVHMSEFQGLAFARTPDLPFGWVVRNTAVVSKPGQQADETTRYLSRYDIVTIYETRYFGEAEKGDEIIGWHRIGKDRWVYLYDVGAVRPNTRPAEIPAGDHWIEIDLYEQSMAVYNGNDEMVYATLVSTGLPGPGWRTPPGLFQIYRKVTQAKMSGGGRADWYFLEDVTASMYFTQSYALHAAYWHDDFGRFKSHGCVNMSPKDAEWLYGWTTPRVVSNVNRIRASEEDPGTWVWVHE